MMYPSPHILNVCVADDEAAIQKSIIARLRVCGIPVRMLGCADNAEKAISLYWTSRPDVFFIDINMPGMDGLNLIRKIKQEDSLCKTRFIIITGYDDYGHLREAIQTGVADYLKKPIFTKEFNKVLAIISDAVSKEKEDENNQRKLEGSVKYEDIIAEAQKNLLCGIVAGIYAPSYSTLSDYNKHIQSILMTESGSDYISVYFQNIKNFALYIPCFRPDSPKYNPRSLLRSFMPLIQKEGMSIVYALPSSEPLTDIIIKIEQTINKRFIRSNIDECILESVKYSPDLSVLEYALENGEEDTCRKTIDCYLNRGAYNLTSIPCLSILYREIILLVINKYVLHHLPVPEHFNAELSLFALCRYPSIDNLYSQLCGMIANLTQKTAEGKNNREVIALICDFLKKNYKQNITLNGLADKFYMSPPYLSRRFKEKTGFTFVQYLEDIRMEKAYEYLCRSDVPVTEISQEVGYMDPAYFAKVFKKKYLISPSDYRLRERSK